MKIERTLQYAIAALAATGTLLLGMGSDNVVLPLLAIIVAASSLYVTDLRGWVQLDRNIASLAAIGAVLISVFDFFQLGRERQLLAIAYLLIYLQIVLMYQRKDIRVYWQLLMLSLLQVVVAAALNFNLQFGFLLTAYLFLGLFALSLFFVYREQLRYRVSLTGPAPSSSMARRRRSRTRVVRVGGGEVSAGEEAGTPTDKSFQRALRMRVVLQGIATLAFTFAAFLLLPRVGDVSAFRGASGSRMVGFSETVKLGELGTTIQNQQPVMRVWLLDPETRQPFRLYGEPYFRGTIVNHYNDKRWSLRSQSGFVSSRGLHNYNEDRQLPVAPYGATLQKIVIDPLAEPTVFAIYPAYSYGLTAGVFNLEKQQLLRFDTHSRYEMVLGTTGIQLGAQAEISPVSEFDPDVRNRTVANQLLQPFSPDEPVAEKETLRAVRDLAESILSESGLPENEPIARARALEQYLRTSDRFEYTLTAPERNQAVDPIVDFLTEHPQGHCEYFSTALTLMLRSQGIKARMVLGFKGGDWNSLGKYYQVRQSHAHSWTEAFIGRDQVAGMTTDGWLRLDPTPGTATADDAEAVSFWTLAYDEWSNYSEYLWSNYVIELDAQRQYEGIYSPLANVGDFLGALTTRKFWQEQLPAYAAAQMESASSHWFTTLIVVLTVLVACIIILVCQNIYRWLRKLPRQQSRDIRRAPAVGFYRQLEAILKRHGLTRPDHQTQREFALAVGGQFSQQPELQTVAPLPRTIVDAYYRVCYGSQTLDSHEEATIHRALRTLAMELKDQKRQAREA